MHLSNTCVAFAADAGIVPALGIVKRLLSEEGGRNRVLVFCGTQNEEHAEPIEELLALKDRHLERLSLSFVMPREPDESELLTGALDAAKVRALAAKLFEPRSVREYHVCGPQQLVDDVTGALTTLGIDAARIHRQHGAPAASPARPAAFPAPPASNGTESAFSRAQSTPAQGAPITSPLTSASALASASSSNQQAGETRVEFVMDGRRRAFSMQTHSESILDAASRAGIDLPFSCKAGVCSTCRTKLLKGKVEMKENYALEDWEVEQGFILACQSHATTPQIELTYDEK